MSSIFRLCTAAAVLGATLCPAAQAHSVGTALVQDLSLVVVDLTPGDGLVAGVSFSDITAAVAAGSLSTGATPFDVLQSLTGNNFDPRSAVAPVPNGLPAIAESQYQGGSDGALGAYAYSGLPAYSHASAQLSYAIMLAPHTELRISGSLSAQAETLGPNAPDQITNSGAGIFFDTLDGSPYTYFEAIAHVTGVPGEGNAAEVRSFNYVFTNTGDVPLTTSLFAYAHVAATQSAVVVPEPGSGLMLLAGLLLGGAVLRRRA